MIKTYIMHYYKLEERRRYLLNICRNIKWCSYTSRETISEEQIKKFYKPNNAEWQKRTENLYKDKVPFREMQKGDLSCSINHIMAWKDFVDNDKNYFGLFLEDDAILCDNFYELLKEVLNKTPEDIDMLFIGGGFPHTIAKTIKTVGQFHLKDHPATNCLCSYVMTKKTAKIMYEEIISNKIVTPIDFDLNYFLFKNNMKVYHHVPYLCKEGSSIGIYKSIQER